MATHTAQTTCATFLAPPVFFVRAMTLASQDFGICFAAAFAAAFVAAFVSLLLPLLLLLLKPRRLLREAMSQEEH